MLVLQETILMLVNEDAKYEHMNSYSGVKRFFDIVFSFFMLLVLSPLLIVVALIIKLDSEGPILFTQQRIGINSLPFKIYKFRTMHIDSPTDVPTSEVETPEIYVTRAGNFLRKSSIDELPQLWNILVGEMSFIGPRPVIPVETNLINLRKQLGADKILPGVTGLAQIKGRDDLPYIEKAQYDAQYCHNLSFSEDLMIILKTIKAILKSEHISH